jgi:hypothetical protein
MVVVGAVGVAVVVVLGVVVVAGVVVVVAGVVVVVVGLVVVVVVVVGRVVVVVVGVVVVVVVAGRVVVVEQLDGPFACAVPGGEGFVPSPQLANSCTRTRTEWLEPAENVPENEKLSAWLNWPVPTCVHVVPLSVELKTRTSLSVLLAVVGPFHAVAV